MKNTTSSNPSTGVKVVAGLIAASQVVSAAEVEDTVESLEPTTVVATKFEKNLSDVSSSIEIFDAKRLRGEAGNSLLSALSYRAPGVSIYSPSSQRGNTGNLHIRGTRNNDSQIRLDGVRIHSGSGGLNNFIGSASLAGLSSVEILKGSGGLYGSSAIGGVLSLSTAKGEGDPSYTLFTEFGSFDSWAGELSAQAKVGKLSYNVGITAEDGKNDPKANTNGNDFNKFGYFGRVDFEIDNSSSIGFTMRGIDTSYQNPFSATARTSGITERQRYDAIFTTAFYENQFTEKLHSKVTAGFSFEDFDLLGGLGDSRTERESVYLDNQYAWSDANVSTFGGNFERITYESDFNPEGERNTYGLYVNHSWDVSDLLLINGALAWDDHDVYGDEFTWNTGLVLTLTDSTAIKINAGKAYKAPTIQDVTPSAFAAVDPNLGAEESFNWDVTLEQDFSETSLKISWFENDVEDAIDTDFSSFPGFRSNRAGKSKSSGLEVGFKSNVETINTEFFGSYTYLQRSLESSLPAQTASLGFTSFIGDKVEVGVVAQWVDERVLGVEIDSYTLVGLNGKYTLNENVKFHARVENLFDESYLLSSFNNFGPDFSETPANGRGRGFYGGVTVSF